jgi:wobble nucleotide-excising tRNase
MRKEGRKMSEDKTKETKESRSFEERIFARFDSADERFDRVVGAMDIRITKLENRQYDTKPIWERALAEITELQTRIENFRTEMKSDIESLRTEIRSEFATVRHEMEHALHGVGHKIDALNQNILQVQADQRYVDRRLHELETQVESP